MENTTHNATNDFTEQDQARRKYTSLWSANKSKHDAELERAKELNQILLLALRDISVWMLCMLIIVVIGVIGSSI
jgi:hypothetical protein